jgi:hypothetical protein
VELFLFSPILLHGVDMRFILPRTNVCVPSRASYSNDKDGDNDEDNDDDIRGK